MTDERKTASIEFRATPSAKARWQEAAGGPRKLSAWLTDLADRAAAPGMTDLMISPEAIDEALVKHGLQDSGLAVVVEQEASAGQCPRWMHHRSGVYCGTCKKVN